MEIIMKLATNIRLLLLLTLTLSIGVYVVPAQKTKPAVKQDVWQDIELDLWKVKLSVPKDLKAIPNAGAEEPDPTADDYSETLMFQRTKPVASRLRLEVYVRNLKGETINTENEGKEYNLTPDQMLALDFIGDTDLLNRPDSMVIEARYDKIDDVNGIFVVSNDSPGAGKSVKPNNNIMVLWGTYRLVGGYVQRIMVTIMGKRTQLATMRKIIESMKFGK